MCFGSWPSLLLSMLTSSHVYLARGDFFSLALELFFSQDPNILWSLLCFWYSTRFQVSLRTSCASPGVSYCAEKPRAVIFRAPGVLTLVVWFLRLFNRGIKEKRKENANRQLIPILPIQVQDDRICTESVLSSVRVSIFPRPGYRIAGPHATAPPARRGACYPHRFLRKSARYLGFFHVHSTSSAAFLLRCLCDWVKI